MVPIFQYLIDGKYGLKILVYSGDDDSVCATIGSQQWIWDMGYAAEPLNSWKQQLVNGQPSGYLTQFSAATKFAFLTVHGAGDEVPTYKLEVAIDLFNKYLQDVYTGN